MTPRNIYEQTGRPVKIAGRKFGDENFVNFLLEFRDRPLTGFINLEWSGIPVEGFEEQPGAGGARRAFSIEEHGKGTLLIRDGAFINALAVKGDYLTGLEKDFLDWTQFKEELRIEAQERFSFLNKAMFNMLDGFDIDGYAEYYFDPRIETLSAEISPSGLLKLETYRHVKTNYLADRLSPDKLKPEWSWD